MRLAAYAFGNVFRERGKRALRRRVGRQIGLPAMRHHRNDVHDAPGLSGFDQMSDHMLHCKEGAPRIRIEMSLPELEAGVKKRAAICYAGRVHEAVDAAKMRPSGLYELVAILCV